MKTALENVKDLEIEVRQWQGRVEFAKGENDRLTRQTAALKQEAENIRSVMEQDALKTRQELKAAQNKLNEAKAAHESQRAEFEATLTAFKQERNAFEREKQTALDMKTNYGKMSEKVAAFIRIVRQEAERL